MAWEWLDTVGRGIAAGWSWWTTGRITAAMAGVGGVAAVGATRAAVHTLGQARADSRERARPLLVPELRSTPYVERSVDFVLVNRGATAARRVKVTFDPDLPQDLKRGETILPFMVDRYDGVIDVIAPGVELLNIYSTGDRDGARRRDHGPPEVAVTIAYESGQGGRYRETFHLDVKLVRTATFASSSTHPDRLLQTIRDEIRSIAKDIRIMAAGPRVPGG